MNDHTFQIPVCVMKNLSSTVILGNKFLSENQAKIDYTKRTITFNKQIKTKIMNFHNKNNTHRKFHIY